MTNPTDLLPRYHAASQWLAEHHPDAPRLPEWIQQLSDGGWVIIGNNGYGYDEHDCETFQDNPDACLAGAVVWAIKVYGWAWHNEHVLGDLNLHHSRHDVESWTLSLLESICTGREG